MTRVVIARPSRARIKPAAFASLIALLAVAWLPSQVRANHVSSAMSVSVGSPITLVSGVFLAVPVNVSCPVLEAPFTGIFSDEISLSVTQKVGRELASGFGGVSFQSPIFNGVGVGIPVVCDGTPRTIMVNVFPNQPNSGPFHGGRAVASVSFRLGLYDPDNPNFFSIDQNFTSSGPQSIGIRGG